MKQWMVVAMAIMWTAPSDVATAQSPGGFRPGLYRILSGTWYLLSMLSPPGGSPLPDADRTFLDIAIDPGARTATMAILGDDRQTVNYLLTNGIIMVTGIYFHAEYPLPPAVTVPWVTQVDFTITNQAGALWMEGSLNFAYPPGPTDAPAGERFQNVQALLLPSLTIQAGQGVEISWSSESNKTYQVQWQSAMTPNQWINLGPPMRGNGLTNGLVEERVLEQPQKFYRLLIWP